MVENFSVMGYAKKKLLAANIKNNQQDNFNGTLQNHFPCIQFTNYSNPSDIPGQKNPVMVMASVSLRVLLFAVVGDACFHQNSKHFEGEKLQFYCLHHHDSLAYD